jgi:hypothetical protein
MEPPIDISQSAHVLAPGLKLCYSGGVMSFIGCGWAWLGANAPQIGAMAAMIGAIIALTGFIRNLQDDRDK